MAQMKFWIWLSSKTGIPIGKRLEALDYFGSLENMYYADEADFRQIEGITLPEVKLLCDKSMDDAERILEQCERKNIRVMTMQDAAYPDRLKNIQDPPILLYYLGNMPAFDEEAAIGIVGAGSPTPYGVSVTERLSEEIAACGGYVVSGMSAGLDGVANTGALKAGRPTAGVLGQSVDVIYPMNNARLYDDILSRGVLISECPPGTDGDRRNFRYKNRLISGLSLGLLVTEAGVPSNTTITVNYALEQGRDVFAVPGNIDSEKSKGTNNLIKECAKPVTCAWDVLCEYVTLYPHKIFQKEVPSRPEISRHIGILAPKRGKPQVNVVEKPRKSIEMAIKDFTESRRKIIVSIADTSLQPDDIAEKCALGITEVLSELTLMEMEGIITSLPGRRFALDDDFLNA